MNIVEISTFDTKGGAARVAQGLKIGLESQGHSVSMFVHHAYSTDSAAQNIFQIPQTRAERFIANISANDFCFWRSSQILESEYYKKADIIHLHNIHGNFFSADTFEKICHEKRVVWSLHDMWAITGHNAWGYEGFEKDTAKNVNLVDRSIPRIETTPTLLWNNQRGLFEAKKKLYSETNFTVVPVSHWMEQQLAGSILADKPSRVIHNGININVFRKPTDKASLRAKLGLPPKATIILFASVGGKHNPQKGWQYAQAMVEHFKDHNDVIFVCIGNKEGAAPDSSASRQNQQNLRFVPYLTDQNTLAEYYSAVDIFLSTSLAENFPLVMLEALACGNFIVTFDVGGVKEAVSHLENGYVAKYRDQQDLIKGIEYFLSLTANARSSFIDINNTKVHNQFSQEKMTSKYIELYTLLIAQ